VGGQIWIGGYTRPGVYEKVHLIDVTSLYLSIIEKYNLSPETVRDLELKDFLITALSSLLNLRIETNRLKKIDPDFS
jgi:DNA polymerase I